MSCNWERCKKCKNNDDCENQRKQEPCAWVENAEFEIKEYEVPLEDFIETSNNKDKRIFELESGLEQANFKIKELKKNVDKYKQYKGFFTVCSKELMRAFDEIDRLKEVEQSYEMMSKEYASYIKNSIKVDDEQQSKNDILKEKIRLLRPILEKYANTYMGTPTTDGRYQINHTSPSIIGECIMYYDPRPAKEGIDIIDSIDEV